MGMDKQWATLRVGAKDPAKLLRKKMQRPEIRTTD